MRSQEEVDDVPYEIISKVMETRHVRKCIRGSGGGGTRYIHLSSGRCPILFTPSLCDVSVRKLAIMGLAVQTCLNGQVDKPEGRPDMTRKWRQLLLPRRMEQKPVRVVSQLGRARDGKAGKRGLVKQVGAKNAHFRSIFSSIRVRA